MKSKCNTSVSLDAVTLKELQILKKAYRLSASAIIRTLIKLEAKNFAERRK